MQLDHFLQPYTALDTTLLTILLTLATTRQVLVPAVLFHFKFKQTLVSMDSIVLLQLSVVLILNITLKLPGTVKKISMIHYTN